MSSAAWMSVQPGLLTAALCLFMWGSGCATAPVPEPTSSSPPTRPAPESQGPPLPDIIPEEIASAPDATHRLFACMAFNHVTLLQDTNRAEYEDALNRLGELTAARETCQATVRQLLKGFEPAILAFETEWMFYMTYFALTAEVFTEHNPQTICVHLDQTVQAAKVAQRHARIYHQWLDRELQNTSNNPDLARMLQLATEKVSGLTIATTELTRQHTRECKTR